MNYQIDNWQNCYDLGWKGIICDEAFSHPAKYSRGLIFRIVEHALAEGMIQPGQIILDPFGGVALGALPSLMNGLSWIGCELEPRFVELGQKNIELWNGKFSTMPRWTGTAQILQGDSRRLSDVVKAAGLVVGSPPYADTPLRLSDPEKKHEKINEARILRGELQTSGGGSGKLGRSINQAGYGSTDGNLGNLPPGSLTAVISSPPFAGNTGGRGEASRQGIDAALFDRHSGGMKKGTGSDPANLDHLPMGQVGAVIASPPFSTQNNQPASTLQPGGRQGVRSSYRAVGSDANDNYGSSSGQLGAMVVGSPPYEGSIQNGGDRIDWGKAKDNSGRTVGRGAIGDGYGQTPGQIGTESGETFWSAARLIVEQCALLLPPGAFAIWVVKSYVKNGKLVDFPGQWRQLCEACGFEAVHEHRAMLVKANGSQATIDGEMIDKSVARKSFFRRLAEKNGSPPIDFETILCMRRV